MTFCSIYIIKNTLNNKVYIGQTWRLVSVRWHDHLLPSRSTHCVKLTRAIKKYNKENFHPELLTICHTQEIADYWEKYFINKFDSIKQGYNTLEGGGLSRRGTKHSIKTKKHMSISRMGGGNSNSILSLWQVNLIRDEYKLFKNPRTGTKYGAITMLSKKYNVSISGIFDIVKGNHWR
jgi:group I intron endonuclease